MRGLFGAVWDEPRAPHPPARVWRDWVVVGVLAALTGLEAALRPGLPWRIGWAVVAVALLPPLLWRRTRPLLVVAIVFGVLAVASVVAGGEPEQYVFAGLLLVPYALFRWGSGREVVLGSVILLVKTLLPPLQNHSTWGDAVAGLAVVVAVGASGAAVRSRAGVRARELERVKLLEREQLSRDLHDTVAHHVSAMAIRAQAGIATAKSDPDAAVDALQVIDDEAVQALAELRAMVRVLRRGEPADLAPSPGIAELAALASAQDRPVVAVEIAGELGELTPAVGAALFRIAQESVTNARRHGRHVTRIEVRVEGEETQVQLRVMDDGDPVPAQSHGFGLPGFGLVGMRERAELLGGVCEAGPGPDRGWPDRGWVVTAVLPRTPSA